MSSERGPWGTLGELGAWRGKGRCGVHMGSLSQVSPGVPRCGQARPGLSGTSKFFLVHAGSSWCPKAFALQSCHGLNKERDVA